MAYESLEVTREGRVGWLVFNRPDVGNAINAGMFDELEQAWQELDADPQVRVIVNTGAGPAFCTGLDVVELSKDREALREHSRRTRDAQLRFTAWHLGVGKPVIAAVNGVCAGGGLHFVADADIVIAAADATFLDPHVSVGQVVAYEAITLARKSPMEPILRMALVGAHERMPATRAYELGIVSQVVDPPGQLRAEAQALAEKVARNSPTAMRLTKRALWGALEAGLTDASREGAKHLVAMWGHPDQEEGPRAFAEKREAEWQDVKYETLLVERYGPVGWLVNNRPDRLNAMSAQMRDEFADAWRELDDDPKVKVIVHTGAGRAFQTGVDVTEIATDGVGMQRYRDSVERFDLHFTAWHQKVEKPVITAVNGICAGGGFHWIADADIVLAAADAQFFDPHVSIGQVVALEAIALMRKMPAAAVMRMALVGRHERLSARRAYELGMVSQVVDPPERLRAEAQALAETIAANDPAALRAVKRALWSCLETGLTEARTT